ncbi:NAD-dependent epimerase/dehydratase family protein [Herbidospora sp. NEAU-GS84]|uniref:NAD-dependent epimerase/dehydratase family protein n=1 Tax=Herbidospora solisilvae TaxID=2696284 RepID=A0A7C9NIJ9_9ACTN|nr:NAD-dependent epimerase/dehydratase family protein [Herbidospora solisilvae]
MRVVVVGATGNVGTSLIAALESDPKVTTIVGVARRQPRWEGGPKTTFRAADISTDDLQDIFSGADAVIHLAWLFQPMRRPILTWRNNVLGGIRVFNAVAEAGVPKLVYASSVGAYSPGGGPVDESWPTHGWPAAPYGREKAYLERVLDVFELEHPSTRVVRMRPGFIFKREAASEQRRLFGGPFTPRAGGVPLIPDIPGLRLQILHTDDAARAFHLAATQPVKGAFNIAAEPVLDMPTLAELLDARLIPVPISLARAAVAAAWRLRLIPATPGMLDIALHIPLMDTRRAREELDWTPRHAAPEALLDFLSGLREGAGMDTEPLKPDRGLRGRIEEVATGVGERP